MNFLGFNINITRASRPLVARGTGDVPLSEAALAWLRGDDVNTAGGPRLINAYQQSVWVHRAVSVLAEQIANIPFLFSRGERGRENLITSGPLLDFYARPHPQINRFQYWELRIMWLMLRGECFRVPIYQGGRAAGGRASTRALKKILILDPANFEHIIENNKLAGWRYTGLGPQAPLASQVFLPEEVWFEKLPNPFDFWRGASPLSVASVAAQTDFAASCFMKGLIENNGDLGVIVRAQTPLDPPQREQIKAALRDRKRRAGIADQPLLLWSGAEIVKPQLSGADMQFLENRKFSRAEICAAFGVPEEIVTITDNAKYDVMAGSRLNFIENRVAPLCARLEAEEEATVKAIDPTATGWFDIDSLPILQDVRRTRLTAAKAGFDMGIPFNELNRVFDLGFKPIACGDNNYLPAKLQNVTPSPKTPTRQPQVRSCTMKTETTVSPLSPIFGTRLVTLSDGRPGLRGGMHVQVYQPTADASPSPSGEGRGEGSSPPIRDNSCNSCPPPNSCLDFVSSDETLDRYGEIICAAGWHLADYQRNPVFQNAHQYGDVIFTLGKALITEVRTVADRQVLFQRIEFAIQANPMARIAHGLYSGGFLHTVSVGFIPIRWEDASQTSSSSSSIPLRRRYLEQELLEVSAVAIPANPNALALALKSGAVEKTDLKDTFDLLRQALSNSSASVSPSPSGEGRGDGNSSSLAPAIDYRPLYRLARQLRNLMRHT